MANSANGNGANLGFARELWQAAEPEGPGEVPCDCPGQLTATLHQQMKKAIHLDTRI